MVNSSYPLLIMAEPEDEVYMRHHAVPSNHPSSAVITWRRFPEPTNRSGSWRYRSAHVMDKLNLFGMPFRRLVWLDADVFIRRSIDELCELPDDVQLATGLDAEGVPTKCWPRRASCPGSCLRTFNYSQLSRTYVGIRIGDWSSTPQQCPYIIQSGVMVLTPLNLTAFNRYIVGPVARGEVHSYDHGDQGIISSLMYGSQQLFGSSYMRLHPLYNVIARHAKHTETKWGGREHNTAAVMHFTRETRPWQNVPMMGKVIRGAEYQYQCGALLCDGVRASRKGHHNHRSGTDPDAYNATYRLPDSIGLHEAWYSFCNITGYPPWNTSPWAPKASKEHSSKEHPLKEPPPKEHPKKSGKRPEV